MFRLLKQLKQSKKNQARLGILQTMHGEIKTPFFMTIATRGAVKGLTSRELEELGAPIILANTYHLFLRPGEKIISNLKSSREAGSSTKSGQISKPQLKSKIFKKPEIGSLMKLHAFMNWPYPILTDSGGFQVFSLAKSRKITERGVEFRSDLDGRKYLLTPEKSIEMQMSLGSDIVMVLDECVEYPASREYVKNSIELTTRWAERCKKHFDSLTTKRYPLNAIFGIVQGGVYKDLRKKSAQDLMKIGFDGYAIGGLAVGEPRERLWEIVKYVCGILPKEKPRYLMGVGMPEDIVRAVNLGCDMFDCVIPTRNARHAEIFILNDRSSEMSKANFAQNDNKFRSAQFVTPDFYKIIHILNSEYKNKFEPVDKNCDCFTCQNYTLAYLHHLFRSGDFLGQRLATIHNIKFYLELMEKLRA
ncbi:MAG: tRNA guanosine(34) transglycosylase Tgt [Patescibacteria group bacterium]